MIRNCTSCFAIALVVSLAAQSRAADPSPAEVVDSAIKAAGGAEALAKQKAMTWSEKGTYYGMGGGLPYTANYATQLPDKFRMEIVDVFTIVFDGKKGWVSSMGSVTEMEDDRITEQREKTYASNLTTLLPLKEKSITLTAAGEGKVDGKATIDIKVSSKDHRDVTLSFDKETHLLAKVESTVKAEEQGGKEVKQVITFSGYDEVAGIKMPKKYVVTRDGEKFVEAEMSDLAMVDKHDEGTFGKPE
jgi:hypothetical protein